MVGMQKAQNQSSGSILTSANVDFPFDLSNTTIIKGIAIILMTMHHFWGFPDWLTNGNYYIGIRFFGTTFESFLGVNGHICIAMFLFLTGYGMYYSFLKGNNFENVFRKIVKLLLEYWLVLFIFCIPISMLLGKFIFDWKNLLLNMFAYNTDYVVFGWYIRLFLQVMILLPFLKKLVGRNLLLSIGLTTIPFFIMGILAAMFMPYNMFTLGLHELFFWIPSVMIGYISAKFQLFRKVKLLFVQVKIHNIFVYLALVILIPFIRIGLPYPTYFDAVYSFIFIFASMSVLHMLKNARMNRILHFLGENSLYIWLLQGLFFFNFYPLQFIAYFPKVSVLVLIWVLILTSSLSVLIRKMLAFCKQLISPAQKPQGNTEH